MILGKSVGTQYHKLTASETPIVDHKHLIKTTSSAPVMGGAGDFRAIELDGNNNWDRGRTESVRDFNNNQNNSSHYNISPSLVLIYAIRILK